MYYGKIAATAAALPENIVTNHDLENIFDTSDEWIFSRTGIKERRITTHQNTSDLCQEVAEKLLAARNVPPAEIGFIIVATMTPDYQTPSVACQVQGAIGANEAFAFDLSGACSGFVYALSMADKLMRDGQYQKGLVIGGETLSKVLDWNDRSTAVLFGDGAAGVLLEKSETPMICYEKLQADGSRGLSLTAGYRQNRNPFFKEVTSCKENLEMEGRSIFDFATRDVVKNILEVLDEAEESPDHLAGLFLHQANQRILEKIARKTKIPIKKFPHNMERFGNTSAASIPLLLNEAVVNGHIRLDGTQKIVLTGFGGGLTWGSLLVNL